MHLIVLPEFKQMFIPLEHIGPNYFKMVNLLIVWTVVDRNDTQIAKRCLRYLLLKRWNIILCIFS